MSKFIKMDQFKHDGADKTGVLLCNLGTPDGPTAKGVRRFLAEFLSDPRVVEIPRLIWWFILRLVILPLRPRHVAEAYASVWMDEGSPLMVYSKRQRQALAAQLSKTLGDLPVELGMCYGQPSVAEGLAKLRQAGVRRVLVLPLYPQYSATSTGAVFDAVTNELQRVRWIPELRFINDYHAEPALITALASSIKEYWAEQGRSSEKLLMSFHGLPKAMMMAGDPYSCECYVTARLLAEALELKDDEWQLTFQSRLGKAEWLKPYTDATLKQWAEQGVSSVDVVCPGFAADCLETLEEMAMQNRDLFLENGGSQYRYIEALNDRPDHIEMMAKLVERHTQGWSITGASEADLSARQHRAEAAGAKA